MPQTSKSELIEQILQQQLQAQRFMRDDSLDAWLALNLSIAQLKSLLFINFEGETNFKGLATALGVSPPNVTGIVDRLVDHDLVSREYNQLNRREQKLKLTVKGKDLINGLRERLSSRLSNLLERLDIQDLAALAQGLNALNQAAQQEPTATTIGIDREGLSRRPVRPFEK